MEARALFQRGFILDQYHRFFVNSASISLIRFLKSPISACIGLTAVFLRYCLLINDASDHRSAPVSFLFFAFEKPQGSLLYYQSNQFALQGSLPLSLFHLPSPQKNNFNALFLFRSSKSKVSLAMISILISKSADRSLPIGLEKTFFEKNTIFICELIISRA